MSLIHEVPLTDPQMNTGHFSQSEGQTEYVACKRAGLKFSAAGQDGEWLYFDGETIVSLRPNGATVVVPFRGANWITEARKL